MKLGLGTVQFGCDYGISNTKGQVSLKEVERILEIAITNNIDILDTAQGYGDAEKVLSNFDLTPFKIITKMSAKQELETSLESLKCEKVYALMFHNENEINDISWDKFTHYKKQNLATKVGISVYTPEKLLEIIDKYPIDIVQLPLNIVDQRFKDILPILKAKNIEIHTRSAFLQGLLLMDIQNISDYFEPIRGQLKKVPEPRMAHLLNFLKQIKEVDNIIVGCTSQEELDYICVMYNTFVENIEYIGLQVDDIKLINPSLWNKA